MNEARYRKPKTLSSASQFVYNRGEKNTTESYFRSTKCNALPARTYLNATFRRKHLCSLEFSAKSFLLFDEEAKNRSPHMNILLVYAQEQSNRSLSFPISFPRKKV